MNENHKSCNYQGEKIMNEKTLWFYGNF